MATIISIPQNNYIYSARGKAVIWNFIHGGLYGCAEIYFFSILTKTKAICPSVDHRRYTPPLASQGGIKWTPKSGSLCSYFRGINLSTTLLSGLPKTTSWAKTQQDILGVGLHIFLSFLHSYPWGRQVAVQGQSRNFSGEPYMLP